MVLLACGFGVCSAQTGGTYGISDGGANWTVAVEDPIPGIDAASVSVVKLFAGAPKGVSFVVWSDLPNGRSGSGGGGMVGGASFKGHHRATGGRRLDFHAKSTDGKTATVTIADVTYDLDKGSLFLVATGDKSPKVVQVEYETTNFPTGKKLMARAKSMEVIRRFFKKHKAENLKD